MTDRAIEETIMLNYEIRRAVRTREDHLPAAGWSMRDARISSPMLRRKAIEATLDAMAAESPLRVRLELQGDAMNDLRVLVQNDRLLTTGDHSRAACPPLRQWTATLPDFLRRQFVVLESTNRDELIVNPPGGPATAQPPATAVAGSFRHAGQEIISCTSTLSSPAPPRASLTFHLEDARRPGNGHGRAHRPRPNEQWWLTRATGPIARKSSSRSTMRRSNSLTWNCRKGPSYGRCTLPASPSSQAMAPRALAGRSAGSCSRGEDGQRRFELPSRAEIWRQASGGCRHLLPVDFPLVRKVKSYPHGKDIAIERSLLDVYVPKSHDWYFDGKLHPTDAAEQTAARVSALNQQGQRLIEAYNDKDPTFTRRKGSREFQRTGLIGPNRCNTSREAKIIATCRARSATTQAS